MIIQTPDGIDIYVMPECARCKLTGLSPEDMDECPLRTFDEFGQCCVPEACDEYAEAWV